MNKMILLLLFVGGLFAQEGAPAQKNNPPKCLTYSSKIRGKEVRYCVHRSHPEMSQENEPVVYFMHGMYGSADSYLDTYSPQLQKLVSNAPVPNMTIISFDTEATSFFSDIAGKKEGTRAYETWFMEEFIPYIEEKYPLCRDRECRMLMGLSMGGFGALKTALKYPEKFSSVAVNCPALPPFSIFEEDSAWMNYFGRHPVGKFFGKKLLNIVRETFPTRELFESNDPIHLVEKIEYIDELPSIYYDVGGMDTFGFQEGAKVFKAKLDGKKIPYEFFIEPKAAHDIYSTRGIETIRFLGKKLIPQFALNK